MSALLKPNISTRLEGRVHIDEDWQPFGVTEQFLMNAADYHKRYTDNKHWKGLLNQAFDLAKINRKSHFKILDIGSGSGNTVFAATELLPDAVIYANDISPQLLQILVDIQEHIPQLKGRIEAYCFDLHKDFFADNTFDLVIGGSILHHMFDPEAALRNVAKSLRSGGKIIMFEPLEIGGHIMTAIYLSLISELESELSSKVLAHFKAMCHDYEARFGVPRVKPWTQHLDDKWLFHESYLKEMCSKIGLAFELIAPSTTDFEKLFSNSVRITLNLAGCGNEPVPDKLWDILAMFDANISLELKKRFTTEGIVILSKS